MVSLPARRRLPEAAARRVGLDDSRPETTITTADAQAPHVELAS
jgi:hypothetical protein